MKKIVVKVLKILGYVLGIVLAYVICGLVLPLVEVPAEKVSEEKTIPIYLYTNGVHTDFHHRFVFFGLKSTSKYIGVFECKKHNTVFVQSLTSHLKGSVPQGCEKCWKEHHNYVCRTRAKSISESSLKASHEDIQNRFDEVFDGRLTFLQRDPEDYRYGFFSCTHEKILRTTIQSRKNMCFPLGCSKCTKEIKKPKEKSLLSNVRKRVNKNSEGKYFLLKRDEQDERKGVFRCREHQYEFTQRINKNLSGQRGCPFCKLESKYSQKAKKVLSEMFSKEQKKVEFEKTFSDCKNGKYFLRFDFFIKHLNLLIEIDGEPHFYPVEKFGREKGFENRLKNDKIKDNYCLRKNINFLRIGFYEINRAKEIITAAINEIEQRKTIYRIHNNKIPKNF